MSNAQIQKRSLIEREIEIVTQQIRELVFEEYPHIMLDIRDGTITRGVETIVPVTYVSYPVAGLIASIFGLYLLVLPLIAYDTAIERGRNRIRFWVFEDNLVSVVQKAAREVGFEANVERIRRDGSHIWRWRCHLRV